MEECVIDKICSGNVTPKDLLKSEAGYLKAFDTEYLARGGQLFMISDGTFYLSVVIKKNRVVFQRNNKICELDITEAIESGGGAIITIIWSPTKLRLECNYKGGLHKREDTITPPTIPSTNLISWARRKTLIETQEYANEEALREKMHSLLLTIQDKIYESGSFTSFWNIVYDGQAIKERNPKREIEVQPFIHAVLSDACLLAGIEIVPEYKTGVGDLDFLFIAKIKDGGFGRFCAEFKNAHSPDLFHGITHQLPAYMTSKNAPYGAYCVLNYRGEWFHEPKFESLAAEVNSAGLRSKNPHMKNIRVIVIDLSKPTSASKM